ncbi:hypothetical protein [Nocardioides conyzicola]|uniref:Uncharacterized protein n=1 Tax=Nocardioides conyzicola TaxID=1651781 RepID=A0ABP8XRD5_9ACTN
MHTLDEASVLSAPRARQLSDRADEFRIILSARQEADAILADAHVVRLDAVLQAEAIVAAAQASADEIRRTARAQVADTNEESSRRHFAQASYAALSSTRRQAATTEPTAVASPTGQAEDRTELRPLGWLFRADRS